MRRAANITDGVGPIFASPENFNGVKSASNLNISFLSTNDFNPLRSVYCIPKLNVAPKLSVDDSVPVNSNFNFTGISILIPATGVGMLISAIFSLHSSSGHMSKLNSLYFTDTPNS